MSQTTPINCDVCQCKVELDPSFCSPNDDDRSSGDCLYATKLRDSLDMTQSGGNILDIFCNSSNPLQFPLCKKCFNSLSKELNKQLSELEAECVNYEQELSKLEATGASSDNISAKKKLEGLEREEAELMEELKRLDAEEKALQSELEAKQKEKTTIHMHDLELYRKLRDNHRKLIAQNEESRGLNTQLNYLREQLDWLTKVPVLDMTFYIWMDNDYGTINGLRLGRLRHDIVEWNEINAAFGQVALLLQVLAERVGLRFENYEICPCGSQSFIRTSRGIELPLYGTGGWRPFGHTLLDQALLAFMDCFCQLEVKLRMFFAQGSSQILPYRMTKEGIFEGGTTYTVKMLLNSEERWSKTMKYLLSNFKRAIGIVEYRRQALKSSSSNASYTELTGP